MNRTSLQIRKSTILLVIFVGSLAWSLTGCAFEFPQMTEPSTSDSQPVQTIAETNNSQAANDAQGSVLSVPAHGLVSEVPSSSNVSSVIPDRLIIQGINLDTSIVKLGWSTKKDASGRVYSEWDVANNAAGWHKNSSIPNQSGNVVMSGHNNILGSVFRDLDLLNAGDIATVWSGGERFDYRIDQIMILPERYATHEQRVANASWINQMGDDRLTLVSCWPRDDNSHRIVVVGYPVTR